MQCKSHFNTLRVGPLGVRSNGVVRVSVIDTIRDVALGAVQLGWLQKVLLSGVCHAN